MTARVHTLHPQPAPVSQPLARALGSLAGQLLPETEKRLDVLLQQGELLTKLMGALLDEIRDERTPDFAHTVAVHKLTQARIDWHNTSQDAAKCIRDIHELRTAAEMEPHFVQAVIEVLTLGQVPA